MDAGAEVRPGLRSPAKLFGSLCSLGLAYRPRKILPCRFDALSGIADSSFRLRPAGYIPNGILIGAPDPKQVEHSSAWRFRRGQAELTSTGILAALVPSPKRHTVRYFFAPSAGIRSEVIREPGSRRRRGCEAAPRHSNTGLDEEAVRPALRDELIFDPLALGPPPRVWLPWHSALTLTPFCPGAPISITRGYGGSERGPSG